MLVAVPVLADEEVPPRRRAHLVRMVHDERIVRLEDQGQAVEARVVAPDLSFRARSAVSTVLLVAALLLMLRVIPTGPLVDPINQIGSWMLLVPNLAAKRAILIGVGLGVVATALKIVLGIERSYLGKD